jgi:DNA-binding NarL/FixJ family response regulator
MRIVLATGNTDLRLAIQLMLSEEPGIKIVGSASDCAGLIALAGSTCPDLVLLDWDLHGGDLAGMVENISSCRSEPTIKVVVLGRKRSLENTVLGAGADGYVLIGDPPEKLLQAVRQISIS